MTQASVTTALDKVSSKGRVLLVEDDAAARHGVANALRMQGYEVFEAEGCNEGLALFTSIASPDVVLTDLRLPDGDAVTLLPRLRAIDPSVPVYIITGFASIDVAVRAVKLGAEDFFTKPVEMKTLLDCVAKAIARRRATQSGQRRRLSSSAILQKMGLDAAEAHHQHSGTAATTADDDMDGGSGADSVRDLEMLVKPIASSMVRLEEELERLRGSESSVLILGETGTGKSALARRIFDISARSGGPFIEVHCAGISRDVFESALFGERGDPAKQGLFDAAHEGTLFLDEIGDIDLQVQPKILKVFDEKTFRRVGDARDRNADVRLIAATHHDLLSEVGQKTFRADLFYRISTVTLRLPALRERIEDLPLLIEQLLRQERAGDVPLDREAFEKLRSYTWPGNIRELKNVLHRALISRQGESVSANDVHFDADTPTLSSSSASSSSTLEEVEREHIARALAAEGGRVKDAARRLGIPRSTLYQKIKNYKLSLPPRTKSGTTPTPAQRAATDSDDDTSKKSSS